MFADEILSRFEALQTRWQDQNINDTELLQFVEENFDEEGHELIETHPKDWRKKLASIYEPKYKCT